MTHAAPTASWRKVCEEYFTRLVEDLEQNVDSEVESRVSTAIEAALRGAVTDAVAESRRALAEELNQSIRRLRRSSSADELYTVLLDVSIPFSEQAVVFSIDGRVARAERMRRPAAVEAGEGKAGQNLPALEIAIDGAAAFTTALDTRDPVIAMSAPAELSGPLVELCGHKVEEKVYLFPLVVREKVAGVLFAAGSVHSPPLELLSEVTALQLENLTASSATEPAIADAQPVAPAEQERFVSVSSIWQQPETPSDPVAVLAAAASAAAESGSVPSDGPQGLSGWRNLSRDEQHKHLAAQRFARVQVAEMRLAQAEVLRSGRDAKSIYGALKQPIDTARENFRERFMVASPTMVDYLHLEMMRSLANDDLSLLGPNYPGPLH
jgi:hypothetical protein